MWLDPLPDFRFEWTTVQCPTRSGMWPSVYSLERHTSLVSLPQECWWSNLINNNSYFSSSGPHSLLQDIWSALMTPPRCLKSNLSATVTSRCPPWPLPWSSCVLSPWGPWWEPHSYHHWWDPPWVTDLRYPSAAPKPPTLETLNAILHPRAPQATLDSLHDTQVAVRSPALSPSW